MARVLSKNGFKFVVLLWIFSGLPNPTQAQEAPTLDHQLKDQDHSSQEAWYKELFDPKKKKINSALDALKYFQEISKDSSSNEGSKTLDGVNFVKIKASYITYLKLSDSKTVWSLNSLTEAGLKVAELSAFVTGMTFTALSVLGFAHMAYNVPYIQDALHQPFFGSALYGPQTMYDLDEFKNTDKVSTPYLVCYYYKSVADLERGSRPDHWNYAQKKHWPSLSPQVLYYDFVLLHGRWIKIVNNEASFYRFGALEDPLLLKEICAQLMVMDKNLTAPINLDEYQRIVPLAGYSSLSTHFPLHFYTPIKVEDDKKVQEKALLLLDGHESRQHPDDQKDAWADFLWSINRNRHLTTKSYKSIDELAFLYGSYCDLKRMYDRKEAMKINDSTKLGFNLLSAYNALRRVESPKFTKAALAFYVFDAMPSSISNLDEWVYGKYLDASKAIYDIKEFNLAENLNHSYLVCQYSSNDKSQDSSFWSWVPAHLYERESHNKFYEIPDEEYYQGQFLSLPGRWVQDKKGMISFGTLLDPVKLMTACTQALTKENFIPNHLGDQTFKSIKMTVGNNGVFNNYPIHYYVPTWIEETIGQPTLEKAVRFIK